MFVATVDIILFCCSTTNKDVDMDPNNHTTNSAQPKSLFTYFLQTTPISGDTFL